MQSLNVFLNTAKRAKLPQETANVPDSVSSPVTAI